MMWREWVAISTTGQEELYLVLIEDLSSTEVPDEPAIQLIVNRRHLSPDREAIASVNFTDLAQAKDHCLKEYGVAPSDWVREMTFPRTFQFNYKVSNTGVPQPYPVAPSNAQIVFRFSPCEDENGRATRVLNICGTREGLEYLAAMLVLCADSDKYDPWFHIHLEDMESVETDMDVTIRAPSYLSSIRSEEFSEFKGTPITVDDGDDSSPNAV
jgi:hypothetical protein